TVKPNRRSLEIARLSRFRFASNLASQKSRLRLGTVARTQPLRIPLDPGTRSGVIRALVPVDVGAVGAKRRALSGVGAKRRVKAHAEG
ncbi:MAG TPA: hypothetical protein VII50_04030, partial [Acidothermaceae bacterium]